MAAGNVLNIGAAKAPKDWPVHETRARADSIRHNCEDSSPIVPTHKHTYTPIMKRAYAPPAPSESLNAAAITLITAPSSVRPPPTMRVPRIPDFFIQKIPITTPGPYQIWKLTANKLTAVELSKKKQ